MLISPMFARSSLAEEKAHGPTRALMSTVVSWLSTNSDLPESHDYPSIEFVADHDGCDTISPLGGRLATGFGERQQFVAADRRERTGRGLQRHEPDHLPVGGMDRRDVRRPLDTRARAGSSCAERRAAQIRLPASP